MNEYRFTRPNEHPPGTSFWDQTGYYVRARSSTEAAELGVPATYRALLIELGVLAPRSEVDTLRRQLRELQQQYDRDVLTPLEAETIIHKDTPKIATWARVKEIRESALEKIRARAELARKDED